MRTPKELLRKAIELTGYSPVSAEKLHDPQRQRPITREDFFNLYFAKVDPKTFFFIEVGANDGKTADPLYPYVMRYKLRGAMIEPQPEVFTRLQQTYLAHPYVECVCSAIGITGEPHTFYSVKREFHLPDRPLYMTGTASFDKSHVLRTIANKIPPGDDPERYVQETVVEAPLFGHFAEARGIERIHFLQLDCEGMDWPIIQTIDFEKYRPEIVNFESDRLPDEERLRVESFFSERGYRFFYEGMDMCAYRF